MRYRHHRYSWTKPLGSVRHNWELVGPLGAVNFHVSLTAGYSPSCGLEFHHNEAFRANTGYRADEAPDHINCPLTGGRCWHDGTSLYASETLWPLIESYLQAGDHEAIFRILESEADSRFGHPGDEAEEAA